MKIPFVDGSVQGKLIISLLENHPVVIVHPDFHEIHSLSHVLASVYSRLANEIGEAVPMDEDVDSGKKTGQRWIDVRYDRSVENSFRHSNRRQPLHTDGAYESEAPEISFLYCLQPALVGGFTTFISAEELVEILEKYHPGILDRLQSTPITFSKGGDSKKSPIIQRNGHKWKLTWNWFRVDQENDESAKYLADEFHEIIESLAAREDVLHPVRLRQGEAVFFIDEAVLHGRTDFIGDRHLVKGGIRIQKEQKG